MRFSRYAFWPMGSPYGLNSQTTMMRHSCKCSQSHRTSNRENPSSGFRDMCFGPWWSPYWSNGRRWCTTTSLNNSIERQTEKTHQTVSKIHILADGQTHMGQVGNNGQAHMCQMDKRHDAAQLQVKVIPSNFERKKSVQQLQRRYMYEFWTMGHMDEWP